MHIIEDGPFDARLAQQARQPWLPDTLGDPYACRTRAEVALDPLCEAANLRDLIEIGNRGENGFVIAPAHHLYLLAFHQRRHASQELRVCLFHPVEERAGIAQRKAYT